MELEININTIMRILRPKLTDLRKGANAPRTSEEKKKIKIHKRKRKEKEKKYRKRNKKKNSLPGPVFSTKR